MRREHAESELKSLRDLVESHPEQFVLVVEHDLAVLDYLSDYVCCLYGEPSVYGVVTMPFSVREGINIFLAGFIPTENLRFRTEELTFKVAETADVRDAGDEGVTSTYTYPDMCKKLGLPLSATSSEKSDSDSIDQ